MHVRTVRASQVENGELVLFDHGGVRHLGVKGTTVREFYYGANAGKDDIVIVTAFRFETRGNIGPYVLDFSEDDRVVVLGGDWEFRFDIDDINPAIGHDAPYGSLLIAEDGPYVVANSPTNLRHVSKSGGLKRFDRSGPYVRNWRVQIADQTGKYRTFEILREAQN